MDLGARAGWTADKRTKLRNAPPPWSHSNSVINSRVMQLIVFGCLNSVKLTLQRHCSYFSFYAFVVDMGVKGAERDKSKRTFKMSPFFRDAVL